METVHADKTNRQYQCDQCSYTSYAMKYIYDHKSMAHYNEKEPMCKTCGQKFPSKVLLKTHKCGTDEEKSVKRKIEYVTCKLCDQQFRSKTFVMHYRRVHGSYPPGYENRRKYMWSVGLLSFYFGGSKLVRCNYSQEINVFCEYFYL